MTQSARCSFVGSSPLLMSNPGHMKGFKRSEDDLQSVRFVPPKAWLEAFQAQCSEQLLRRARRFAARRPGSEAYDADELVHDIVLDTLRGVLQWDPSARSLEVHLYEIIRRRARRAVAKGERFPHASVDDVDGEAESLVMAEADDRLLADAPEATRETVECAHDTATALKELAAGKPLLLQLLNAFECGETSKEDVMRVTGMSASDYHNARRQLARLVNQLPSELRARRLLRRGT